MYLTAYFTKHPLNFYFENLAFLYCFQENFDLYCIELKGQFKRLNINFFIMKMFKLEQYLQIRLRNSNDYLFSNDFYFKPFFYFLILQGSIKVMVYYYSLFTLLANFVSVILFDLYLNFTTNFEEIEATIKITHYYFFYYLSHFFKSALSIKLIILL